MTMILKRAASNELESRSYEALERMAQTLEGRVREQRQLGRVEEGLLDQLSAVVRELERRSISAAKVESPVPGPGWRGNARQVGRWRRRRKPPTARARQAPRRRATTEGG